MRVLGDSAKKAHQCPKYSFSVLSPKERVKEVALNGLHSHSKIPGNGYLVTGHTPSFEYVMEYYF